MLNIPNVKVYIVGGYVRDRVLGRECKDHDFVVVGATPQQMLDAGFQQVGAEFPVFLHPLSGDEYALARTERKTGSGYNGFTTDHNPSITLEEDLFRRDLTINAMAREVIGWNEHGHAKLSDEIIDPFGGLTDLQNGVLRHVSEAFADDPLRVLRVARFAARYKFVVAYDTMVLMDKLVRSGELNHLTTERVWSEMEKAIMEPHPADFFWMLVTCGAQQVLFPDLHWSGHKSKLLNRAAIRSADKLTRMAVVFSDVISSQQLLKRLKAPNEVTRIVHKVNIALNKRFRGVDGFWALSVLKELDVFRMPSDIETIISALVIFDVPAENIDKLLMSYRAAAAVDFNSLSPDQREILQGPAVGKAIDAERVKRIEEVI